MSSRLGRGIPAGYDGVVRIDHRTRLVKRIATELGFDRVGIGPVDPPPHAEFLRAWLDRGYAGRMAYLRRHLGVRLDPRRLLPGARSVICVAMNYYHPAPVETHDESSVPHGRFARYAWGQDYHVLVRDRLDVLVQRLGEAVDEPFGSRPFVDTAPILERPVAAVAGLGWIGKNTMLIVPRLGSFVFLGGVMTTLALTPDPPLPDRCGRCRRCIDACPTGALVEPYVMDASRCISYLTIELRDAVPAELRPAVGDRVFGCDACQRACPHNRRAPATCEPSLRVRPPTPSTALVELLSWSRETYLRTTRGRAIRRAKLNMLRRNAAVALGNVGEPEHLFALQAVANDDDPALAEHACWAAERIRSRRNPLSGRHDP